MQIAENSTIADIFERLGKRTVGFFERLGHFHCFLYTSLMYRDRSFFRQIIAAIFHQGTQSLSLIILSSLFIGMVLAMQGYVTLSRFGAEQALGQLIALSLIRELGPVMSSLFFIGRSCSSITAELSLMRATMQVDSLEMTGVNPLARLVAPRLWAVLIVAPLLTAVFIVVAILGGSFISVDVLGVDYGAYWANIAATVHWYDDVIKSLMKAVIFFFFAVAIAIYQGYFVAPKVESVARATTKTVVIGSALTLALDYILTSMTVAS